MVLTPYLNIKRHRKSLKEIYKSTVNLQGLLFIHEVVLQVDLSISTTPGDDWLIG